MGSETNIVRLCLLEASRLGARLFRQNTGQGWIGQARKFTMNETVQVRAGDVLIRNARPFHAGFAGLLDTGGWRTITITPDMVGRQIAQYVELEVKTETGRPSPEQVARISAVTGAGGVAGIVRSPEDVQRVLRA